MTLMNDAMLKGMRMMASVSADDAAGVRVDFVGDRSLTRRLPCAATWRGGGRVSITKPAEPAEEGLTMAIDNGGRAASIGIRQWAAEAGGAELDWETGEGDARLRGWIGANGTRAIETNGDPVFSESDDAFEAMWEARAYQYDPPGATWIASR